MYNILFYILLLLLPSYSFSQTLINMKVYDEVYQTLKDNYPLFQYRSYYNLDSAYQQYKSDVMNGTTENELGNSLCNFISGLDDFHVRISNDKGKCFALSTPLNWHKVFHNDSLQRLFWQNSDATLYKNKFSRIRKYFYDEELPMLRYCYSDSIGYLNITRFQFKLGDGFNNRDARQINLLMDTLVHQFQNLKALIIDLRSCMGGENEYGELIASRLSTQKLQYSYTIKFKTAVDSLEPVQHFIIPSGKDQLNLPIVLLTNKVARSAAEDFILMIKQLPNVFITGEPSWGAFASSKTHTLSNGWKLQYSNEKVYTPNGTIYEGRGIPVDFFIENDWNDILQKNDKVIEEAIHYIKYKKP